MKKIVIIGASYLQLPLVKKANDLGYETHVFAWKDGAVAQEIAHFFYPISITEKNQILAVCKKIQPAGIISIASDLAMLTVNFVAHHLGLVGNSLACTHLTTNKFAMREALRAACLPSPAYCLASHADAKDFSYPLIVKPTDRSGSRGITKLTNPADLTAAITRATEFSFEKQAIIESYVNGREFSIEFLSYQGEHYFLQSTQKVTTGSPYFVELAHHQPAELSAAELTQIKDLVPEALTALAVTNGISHTELKITPAGEIVFIEIGARMGGDMIGSLLTTLSTGFDTLRACLEIATATFAEIRFGQAYYAGIYYPSPLPGQITAIDDTTSAYPQIILKELPAVGDKVSEIRQSGDRCAYFIYQDTQKFNVEANKIINIKVTPCK